MENQERSVKRFPPKSKTLKQQNTAQKKSKATVKLA